MKNPVPVYLSCISSIQSLLVASGYRVDGTDRTFLWSQKVLLISTALDVVYHMLPFTCRGDMNTHMCIRNTHR